MRVTSRLINCNCCNSQSGSNPNSVEFRKVDRHVAYSDYESGLLSCVWVDKHCTYDGVVLAKLSEEIADSQLRVSYM